MRHPRLLLVSGSQRKEIGDTVCVPHVAQAWTSDGIDFPPYLDQQIDEALNRVLRLASAFDAQVAPVDEPVTA